MMIDTFPKRLANEMSFIDDLISCSELSKRLLGQFGDIIRGPRL